MGESRMPVRRPLTVDRSRAARARRRSAPSRRERLLDDIEEIFLAQGFSTVTIDELCRRLSCSKTTLYTVASTREQIIQAVVRHFFARATTAIEARLDSEASPADRIVSYLAGVGAAMHRNSYAFYADMVTFAPTAEIYRMNSQAAARRVQGMIEEGVRDGSFRRADAALAGLTVAYLMDGVQSGEVLDATGMNAGDAFTELGQLLIHGLSVRPEGS